MSGFQRAVDDVERAFRGADGPPSTGFGRFADATRQVLENSSAAGQRVAERVADNLNDLLNRLFPGAAQPPGSGSPTPPLPYEGGQCSANYQVTVAAQAFRASDGFFLSDFEGSRVMTGPIGGIAFRPRADGGTEVGVIGAGGYQLFAGAGGVDYGNASIIGLVRLDGQPDDCGNPNPDGSANPGNPGDGNVSPPWGEPINISEPDGPEYWGVDPQRGGACFRSGSRLVCYGDDGWYSPGAPSDNNRGIPPTTGLDPNCANSCGSSQPTVAQQAVGGGNNNQGLDTTRILGTLAEILRLVRRLRDIEQLLRSEAQDQLFPRFAQRQDLAIEFLQAIQQTQQTQIDGLARILTLVRDNGLILSANQQEILNGVDAVFGPNGFRGLAIELRTLEANIISAIGPDGSDPNTELLQIARELKQLEQFYPRLDIWRDSKTARNILDTLPFTLNQAIAPLEQRFTRLDGLVTASQAAVLAAVAANAAATIQGLTAIGSILGTNAAFNRASFAALGGRILSLTLRVANLQRQVSQEFAISRQNQVDILQCLDLLKQITEQILQRVSNPPNNGLVIDGTVTELSCIVAQGQDIAQFNDVQINSLEDAFSSISGQIALLLEQNYECRTSSGNVPPVAIGSGSSQPKDEVQYVSLDPEVRQVELIITGSIPADINVYGTTQIGEVYGKFGSLTVSYPGVVGGQAVEGFHQWAWTRRTLMNVGVPVRDGRQIRVFFKRGLSWVLYDTGLRDS